jgi:hypothetical protein
VLREETTRQLEFKEESYKASLDSLKDELKEGKDFEIK